MKNVILTGPSGVGKGTIGKKLLHAFPEVYEFCVSCTSRAIRPGDIEGATYYFISLGDFQNKIKNGEFIEYEEFAGNYYGTLKSEIERILSKGKKFIMDVEPKGAKVLHGLFPEAEVIAIQPESFEILEKMLAGRKTETQEKIKQRIEVAKEHSILANKFPNQVMNKYGAIDATFKQIVELIK